MRTLWLLKKVKIYLDDGIGDFGGWDNWEGVHDSVGVFLTDLGDEESSHSRSGSSTKGVCELETLEAVARFGFLKILSNLIRSRYFLFKNLKRSRFSKKFIITTVKRKFYLSGNIKDGIYELGSFCVVTLGPVVSGTRLSENEVVWAEDLSEGTGSDWVHSSGFQIDQNGSGHISEF